MVMPFPMPLIALSPGFQRAGSQTIARSKKSLRLLQLILVCQCIVAISRVVTPKPFAGFTDLLLAVFGFYACHTCVPLHLMLYSFGSWAKALITSLSAYHMVFSRNFGYSIETPDDGYYYQQLHKFHQRLTLRTEESTVPEALGSVRWDPWRVYTEAILTIPAIFLALCAANLSWNLYRELLVGAAEEMERVLDRINTPDGSNSEVTGDQGRPTPRSTRLAFKAFTGEGFRIGSLISNSPVDTPTAQSG